MQRIGEVRRLMLAAELCMLVLCSRTWLSRHGKVTLRCNIG